MMQYSGIMSENHAAWTIGQALHQNCSKVHNTSWQLALVSPSGVIKTATKDRLASTS